MSTSTEAVRAAQLRAELESLVAVEAEAQGVLALMGEDSLLHCSYEEWAATVRIKTREGLQSFDLYLWQRLFAQLVIDNPQIPITLLSSRQTGKTIDILGLMVYLCMSREQFTGLLIHRRSEDARSLARRTKKLISSDIKLISDSLSLIEFPNGSMLYFRSGNHKQENGAEDTARGLESVDVCVIEEASHTKNVAEIVGVIGPCMTHSPQATLILVGTAGKRESYYYESLVEVFGTKEKLEQTLEDIRTDKIEPYQVKHSPTGIALITNWRAIPEFQAEGKDESGRPNYLNRIAKEQKLTQAQVDSEHELIFDSDSTTTIFEYPLVMMAQRGEWEAAADSGVYYAGVDGSGKPRRGRKGDYTVCVVLKVLASGKRQVVKLYRKRGITFERRYAEISEILNLYNPILTNVEANDGLGQTYEENLLAGCPGLEIQRYVQNEGRKALLVNKLVLALERGDLGIPKSAIIDELLSFQQLDDGTMGAVGRYAHDDTVMALGMALVASGYNTQPTDGGWSS